MIERTFNKYGIYNIHCTLKMKIFLTYLGKKARKEKAMPPVMIPIKLE